MGLSRSTFYDKSAVPLGEDRARHLHQRDL